MKEIDKLDIQKIKNDEWNYIKMIYPKAFSKIREWNFSVDSNKNPYDLWLDDKKLYTFFDKEGIYVCPRVDTESEFYVEVWISGCLSYGKHDCINREDAELYGFLYAIYSLERALANER